MFINWFKKIKYSEHFNETTSTENSTLQIPSLQNYSESWLFSSSNVAKMSPHAKYKVFDPVRFNILIIKQANLTSNSTLNFVCRATIFQRNTFFFSHCSMASCTLIGAIYHSTSQQFDNMFLWTQKKHKAYEYICWYTKDLKLKFPPK